MVDKTSNDYSNRHKLGQFFTADSLVELMIDVFNVDFRNKDILEPSCGDCAFIKGIIKANHFYKSICAVDIDDKWCKKNIGAFDRFNILCDDFLIHDFKDAKFDVIVGNPPFNLKTTYNSSDTTDGFLLKCAKLLKPNGSLFLVLPSTILRHKKYETARKYILNNYKVVGIMDTRNYEFLGADVETIIIQIQNEQVQHQQYFYYNNGRKQIIDFNNNSKGIIHINPIDVSSSIETKLSNMCLDDLFIIERGHSKKPSKLHGREINFYDYLLTDNTGDDYFIGIQNIAYRFTSNVIKSSRDNVSDTITMLIPKNKMSLDELMFYSEYLNTSIANYLLHTLILNDCRIMVHIDKYYIDSLLLPHYNNNRLSYLNNRGLEIFANDRDTYFKSVISLSDEESCTINTKWTLPRYKKKTNIK